ncbi:hypothetical protein Pmani_026005 [Petrolisthes manimaculis]|uniref:Uncharacterized protein n=1 Tax=Petrolisthes manimaculis TaxID=1843537 RepID=A0AAE1TXV0_9EUCA|nr:hypothetical protein Pmani_026005 [Petrolisthes manimaculis]
MLDHVINKCEANVEVLVRVPPTHPPKPTHPPTHPPKPTNPPTHPPKPTNPPTHPPKPTHPPTHLPKPAYPPTLAFLFPGRDLMLTLPSEFTARGDKIIPEGLRQDKAMGNVLMYWPICTFLWSLSG